MFISQCRSLSTCPLHDVGHTKMRQAESKHLIVGVTVLHYLLLDVQGRKGDFGVHQSEFLKGFTYCLYRVLFETNGILKMFFSFFFLCRFRNLILNPCNETV